MGIIEELEKGQGFKLKGTGPITYHLGCDYKRDEDGTLAMGRLKSASGGFGYYFGTTPQFEIPTRPNRNIFRNSQNLFLFA